MDVQGIFQCVILFLLFITERDAEITWKQLQQKCSSSTSYKTTTIYKCITPLIEILHI